MWRNARIEEKPQVGGHLAPVSAQLERSRQPHGQAEATRAGQVKRERKLKVDARLSPARRTADQPEEHAAGR
jgi:hypothetical protein